MKTWVKISIIVSSAAALGGMYWLLVWRKRQGVTAEDAQILSSYLINDQDGLVSEGDTVNPFENSFKDVFKGVFPEKAYTNTI